MEEDRSRTDFSRSTTGEDVWRRREEGRHILEKEWRGGEEDPNLGGPRQYRGEEEEGKRWALENRSGDYNNPDGQRDRLYLPQGN